MKAEISHISEYQIQVQLEYSLKKKKKNYKYYNLLFYHLICNMYD